MGIRVRYRGSGDVYKSQAYYRSGDLQDDFANSVSDAGLVFFPVRAAGAGRGSTEASTRRATASAGPRPIDRDEQAFLLDLARRTLQAVVNP